MVQRPNSDFYDHDYFEGSPKSRYGHVGYPRDIYLIQKTRELIYYLNLAGYTSRWLPKNCLVVGCAIGYMVQAMQMDGNIEAHGVDISEYAIERGRKEGIKNLRVGDICQLHFKDKEFEFVVCCDTLEQIPEDEGQLGQAIDELIRVCHDFIVVTVRIPDPPTDSILGEGYHSIHDQNWWVNEFEKRGVKTYNQVDQPETSMAILIFEVPE